MNSDATDAADATGLIGNDAPATAAPPAVPASDPDPLPPSAGDVLGDVVAPWRAIRDGVLAERRSLPCFPADPAFHEDGELAASADACRAIAGQQVCPHYVTAGQRWSNHHCPVRQVDALERTSAAQQLRATEERHRAVALHLGDASRVPARERRLLLAALEGLRLRDTATQRAARQLLEQPRLPAIVGFGGTMGVGKTLSACYLIAKRGGLYCRAAELVRPGFDLERALAAPVLVIDQAGREPLIRSEWGPAQIEDLCDARYAEERCTLWIGNFSRAAWEERYEDVATERLHGDGEWYQFDGPSLRGLAGAALEQAARLVTFTVERFSEGT